MEHKNQLFIMEEANLVVEDHQIQVTGLNQSPNWGRHQVVSPEARWKVTDSSHRPRPPIHNEVQPFIENISRFKLNQENICLIRVF